MYKQSIFLAIFFLAAHHLFAQGIVFQHIAFETALEQAKAEDKLIFIDFYTEWCGPCKRLAAGPFKEQANGDFYNQHFISLKLDAEKEGKEVAARYAVSAYPTLIFVNGNGEIVHQGVGVSHGTDMISFGKAALNASNAKYSWAKLQEMFPNKQNDEVFLKLYLQKMKEFGANPSEAMNAWLNVQTEMEESSEEMMKFLLKNQSNIYVGTKAEDIFNAHYDDYLGFANELQTKQLNRFRHAIFLSSLKIARRNENAALMQVVIDRYQQYDLRARSGDDLNTFKMDYYRFSKDTLAFKNLTEHYVDSVMQLTSIKDIRKEDEAYYKLYSKGKVEGEDEFTDLMLQTYKEGRKANDVVERITNAAHPYFELLDSKASTQTLNDWMDYCYTLIPDKYSVDNIKADLLYREGKTKKAIALKSKAIENMPFTVKKKVNYQHELELMKQNR